MNAKCQDRSAVSHPKGRKTSVSLDDAPADIAGELEAILGPRGRLDRALSANPRWARKDLEFAYRRKSVREFYAKKSRELLCYATSILRDSADAEDALSDTFVEMLEGKTCADFFFKALKSNCLDRLRRGSRAKKLFLRPVLGEEQVAVSGEPSVACFGRSSGGLRRLPGASAGQDPLELLIAQEERDDFTRDIETARRHPKFRYVRRRKWGKELLVRLEMCAVSGADANDG